ncbi:SAF domain-containing protein [Nocardioides sp.]|uniref:SAF domain-containing protein n=1 Tax=Nocardioides sp. TaxID=35761 RepID=UPI0027286B87|nr:SAF domain-containing protein [Nocardioides sp.]MDO9455342.1 SAF domain-containing protein [Nocardioides sp.]
MPLDLSRPVALLGGLRRQVLRRRRLLAAGLTAVAVASTLAATAESSPATVDVLVAARDLPAGEVLDDSDLATVAFAPGSVPAGLADHATGRVVAAPLTRGQPLTEVALVGPAMTGDRRDLTAVPVRLPDAGAVALLRVGDEIDLVATDPQAGDTDTVAPAAVVLAIPTADEATGPTGLPGRLVVVGVAVEEVTALAGAASRSVVTFAWSNR